MDTIKKEAKRSYISPQIELIELDNEISLQLESPNGEPDGGGWSMNQSSPINDPYKANQA